VYYPETKEQKAYYKQAINKLNKKEVKAKCRLAFAKQEKEKEEQWAREGKNPLTRQVS
jgi:predicted S18 family serine protease